VGCTEIGRENPSNPNFEVNEGELFAFAGLWDPWKDPSGNWVETCPILTTTPNAVIAPVHDRMPVILNPDGYELWPDHGMRDCRDSGSMGFMLDVFFEDQEPLMNETLSRGPIDVRLWLGLRQISPE
jgi:hypothetical protein